MEEENAELPAGAPDNIFSRPGDGFPDREERAGRGAGYILTYKEAEYEERRDDMLEFMRETEHLWDRLARAEKPIVLYGTGDGGDKIIAELERRDIPLAGVYVSDDFARGQEFHGITVGRYSDLVAEPGRYIVLIAFASELPELLERFRELDSLQETYAPHVPIFPGDETVSPAWLDKYRAQLEEVYGRLGDGFSRKVFAGILDYKLSGKLRYLEEIVSLRREDLESLFTFGPEESYLDLGAYDGDTVEEFLGLVPRDGEGHPLYRRIAALEPDTRNFGKLEERMAGLQQAGEERMAEDRRGREASEGSDAAEPPENGRISCIHAGIWSEPGILRFNRTGGRQASFFSTRPAGEDPSAVPRRKRERWTEVPVVSVDSLREKMTENTFSYIKIDVEGAEREMLEGAEKTLERDCPKLLMAAYHHDNDIFRLPLQLWSLQPAYRIFLRKHPYVPAWELNFFCRRED